jgi:hypothetical protein
MVEQGGENGPISNAFERLALELQQWHGLRETLITRTACHYTVFYPELRTITCGIYPTCLKAGDIITPTWPIRKTGEGRISNSLA